MRLTLGEGMSDGAPHTRGRTGDDDELALGRGVSSRSAERL